MHISWHILKNENLRYKTDVDLKAKHNLNFLSQQNVAEKNLTVL